ncbi:sterol desaturase family protein [Hymenobacter monticola]|uniref:Sterol desaturase family protein n=1 Tax=Hymenobacter monticola TaxID=1705399 RepID=A0ABY4AZR1_9BACT|nr:sterol desaturase family protein [Hymenobacter monticola]UOE32392.1 sterol desaturase family protein [Hymenobacter monticola]
MHKVELITTAILLAWVAIVITLERIIPYRKGLPFFREGFWTDLVLYTFVQSFALKIIIFDYIIQPLDQHFGFSKLHFVTGWPIWVQVLFFVVTHDFYIYWFHRFQHSSPFFWRTHEAHHSGKQVDWLAGSRSHAVEILINQTIEFAPIILLGADPMVVPIKACIDAVWGIWIHCNIDVRSGRLQYFINGPEMHLWHHADHEEVFYANFSTKFAFWDWMFGTAYLPNGRKPQKWGLPYVFPKDYFSQHVFSVARFSEEELAQRSRLFRAYHGIRGRLLTQLTDRLPALKPLHGWPVPEPYAETIPAQRPGGNFGHSPAPAASSQTPTAVPSR